MAKQDEPRQPQSQRLEDVARSWGKLKAVYVKDMRGLSGGDGQFVVGSTVSWPRRGADDTVHNAKLLSMELVGGRLLLTASAVSGPLVGAKLRMLVDLANCILCFEDEVREKVVEKAPTMIGGVFLNDLLLRVESAGGQFTAEQVSALRALAEHPDLRERKVRIVEALRMDAVRKSGGVASEPGAHQEPANEVAKQVVEVGEAEAVEDNTEIPAGRVESNDPRDRVSVMVKGQ